MFQEFEQALQATGVDLDFSTWAGYEKFFPAMWQAIRPQVESGSFEEKANRVRANAVQLAQQLDWLDKSENQACQITAALDLYHYVTPKLLVLTASLLLSLEAQAPECAAADSHEDDLLRQLFKDVQRTMPLPLVCSSQAKVALWPDYLQGGWQKIQALVCTHNYQCAASELREFTRSLISPSGVKLSRKNLIEIGENPERIVAINRKLEELLPPLIINITLFQLDWQTPEKLSSSRYRYH